MGYWDKTLRRRLTRRRAVIAGSATTAAAAFLVACGGDDDDGGSSTSSPAPASTTATGQTGAATGSSPSTGAAGASGLLTPVVDDTDKLVRGGRGVYSHATPVSLDPHYTGGQVAHGWHAYQQLFRIKEGHMGPSPGEIEGELAESYEFSADRTQVTVKLKQGILFAPQEPVNAREVDAQDVVFSWNRYEAESPRRAELANLHNPDAPVLGIEAIDNSTIVISLKEPLATILGSFAGNLPGTPYIVPREVESPGIDLQGQSNGSGPWYLVEYEPAFRALYKRNPGYKNADSRDLPYMDELEYIELAEYPAFLAQFKAGQLLDQFRGVNPEDILQTKADVPELEVYDAGLTNAGVAVIFGWLPDSPFKDQRVRQAAGLTFDRALFNEVAFATTDFEAEGIPIPFFVDGALQAGVAPAYEGWVLGPEEADFGENAKFYTLDVEEAKKLLDAAGFPDGVETSVTWGDTFPSSFQSRREILMGMMESSGLFRLQSNLISFANEWNPQFRNNKGEFVGMAMTLDTSELDTAVDLYSHYNRQGSRNFGGDEELDRLTSAMLREFDINERQQLAHELQRYEGGVQWLPRGPTSSGVIRIAWPAERIRFNTVWQGNPNRWHDHNWLDMTKPPFA